jgi:hypothetical protein
MADDQSQHVVQIPQAVSIAASVDPSTPVELRQQAVEYLQKVKELSEQTWKVSQPCRAADIVIILCIPSSLSPGMPYTIFAGSWCYKCKSLGPRWQGKTIERAPGLLLASRR